MSNFLSKLILENADVSDDGQWKLTAPLVYVSDVAKQSFTVPAGFQTDLASVPRIPIIFDLMGATSNEPAALHDWLYTSHVVSRSMADAVLREASAVCGVPCWRRNMMWVGVRIFGGSHWN
jgi:hypothetical protein